MFQSLPMTPPPLVLASASPRRSEILTALGLTFEVAPIVGISETQMAEDFEGDPHGLAYHIAMKKAGIATTLAGNSLVIAADTIVVVGTELLGKPADAADAARMLRLLSGRTHQVITGIAIADGPTGRLETREEITQVTFGPLRPADIEGYIAVGEPFGKAGAYGIQGLGSLFITGIVGDYWNVVGFPIFRFRSLLSELGYDLNHWAFGGVAAGKSV